MSPATQTDRDDLPPRQHTGPWAWLKTRLFSSPLSVLATVLLAWLLIMLVPALVEWAFIRADFSAPDAQTCRASGGACWAFIVEKHRLILFGTYPYDEQWRPLIAMFVLIAVIIMSGMRRFWRPVLILIWVVGLSVVAVLMWGGVLGLTYVENARWGGLPLTLILSTFGIAFAFPFGVLLALGRRSDMPAIKALCVVYIELIRGVPLISLLFMSSVMLPLFLPEGFSIDKLLRAQIAIIMFAAAYIAETVRGGLQAIPKGQYEGADSLGLSYWQKMGKIVLPQALKIVIPPLVSIFISLFKDTSLVVIIGIFDLTLAAKAALSDAAWRGFGIEAYIFISLIYFVFCYSMSRYSQNLERRLATGHQR
ncbi:amino acid ABC transporter permease [Bordetella trematum]|uniref:L-amino acid ABC transporter permease n=1 Tax=Bordetella trematum TaxID=123899 RepID=A0A157SCE3_9BORD|nr:amino acid ABC transporter permease [Bordetella trematum]AUL48574.1 amino acid ABC transporter permease [Bordetella trematum]AZR95522.1 amino acid ABC transporter permease [Bordetella trematum]NNH17682.1 amino acid ABC transporter permease [Bordetella trematum]QIM70494.1 amino acid ABC transporter permease [Bordetella trematum]SAI31918.1 L-amino acid ABC transporter permease [Bordetella trematum]